MSDSPYTTQVMQEIVALAGDPSLTLDQLGQNLAALSEHAEENGDRQAVALVAATWDGVNALSAQAGHAFNVAAAAKQVAEQMQAQRDMALQEHGDLVKAIDDMDVSNVKVAGLVEQAEEWFQESLMCSGAYVTNCPACDISSEREGVIPVSHEVADTFHDIITGALWGEFVDEDQIYAEIADFMTEIVKRVEKE